VPAAEVLSVLYLDLALAALLALAVHHGGVVAKPSQKVLGQESSNLGTD
jgi:hypothetical protein